MSISAVTQTSAYPASSLLAGMNCIQLDRILPNSEKWYYLVPVIAAVAIGSIYLPNIGLGLAAGAALAVIGNVSVLALTALNVLPRNNSGEYVQLVQLNPVLASLVVPVAEELIYRGAMQPLLARAIVWIAPTAAATFLGTPLSIATGVSIVATATVFGLIHLFNEQKNAPFQAGFATFAGIAFGTLAAQFGLGAAMAAHVANNTLTIAHMHICLDD